MLPRNERNAAIWDRMATRYDKQCLGVYSDAYQRSIDKCHAELQPDDHVLEIGCGTGLVTLGVAACAGTIVGTDISERMISEATSKAKTLSVSNLDFVKVEGVKQPFTNDSFDTVLLFNVLHYVTEPEQILDEVHRLLKPEGKLLLASDCLGDPGTLRVRLMRTVMPALQRIGLAPTMHMLSTAMLHDLVTSCGFLITDTDVLHPSPVNAYLCATKS